MKNKIIVLLIACLIAFITTVTIKNLYDNQIAQEKQGTPADSSDDAYFNARGGVFFRLISRTHLLRSWGHIFMNGMMNYTLLAGQRWHQG